MMKICAKRLTVVIVMLALSTVNIEVMATNADGEPPIRTISITIVQETRNQFFDQLRKYADTYAFAIRIAPTRPDVPSYLITMWRVDVKGIGTNAIELSKFRISFYKNGNEVVPSETLDELISGLERVVKNIPGAMVLEVR